MSAVQAAAFVDKQSLMVEILATVDRTALCFANMFAETGGFTIANLTENIHYSVSRMAHVWKNRFHDHPSEVIARYGSGPDWQNNAFDEIYGNRMGNHPGTHDGSMYIGRGGPQLTGRDEYREIGAMIGVDLINNPERACEPGLQPAIIAAYWKSKKLSGYADRGDIVGARHVWNGGTNGLDVVKVQYPRIQQILETYIPTTAAKVVVAPTAKIDGVLKAYQKQLIGVGYHEVGEADGKIGGKTIGAIAAFLNDRGSNAKAEYPSDAFAHELDQATLEKWHRPVAPSRAFVKAKDIAPKVASIAPTQSAGFVQRITAWLSGGATVVGGAVKLIPDTKEQVSPYWDMVQEFFPSVPQLVFFGIVAAVAIATVLQLEKAKKATVEDYQQGKIN